MKNLIQRAGALILIAVSVKGSTLIKLDRETMRENAARFGSKRGAVKVNQVLVDEGFPPFQKLKASENALRNWFAARLLPYPDTGWRLALMSDYPEIMSELKGLVDAHATAKHGFLAAYEEAQSYAQRSLQGAYGRVPFPSLERLAQAFCVEVRQRPYEQPVSLRGLQIVDPSLQAWVDTQVTGRTQELEGQLREAQADGIKRLHKMLKEAYARVSGHRGKRYDETLLPRLAAACDLAKRQDISASPEYQKALDDLVRALGSDPAWGMNAEGHKNAMGDLPANVKKARYGTEARETAGHIAEALQRVEAFGGAFGI